MVWHARGKACKRCGKDEWRKRTDPRGWRCHACFTRLCRDGQRRRRRVRDPRAGMLERARYRAKKQGLDFTIQIDDIVLPTHCPALGIPLGDYRGKSHGAAGARRDSPSLDRLVPAWGYVPGNVCVISSLANAIKSNATAAQLEQVARWMRSQGLA